LCKQSTKAGALYQTAQLDKGSLILFGSGKGEGENARFLLDTVFVVADYKEYDTSDLNALKDEGLYWKIVIETAYEKKTIAKKVMHRLYYGATFKKQYNGMYSFSPAHVYRDGKIPGFPRVELQDTEKNKLCYISNGLKQSFKFSDAGIDEITKVWKKIRKISRKNGCVEAVHFDMPPEKR
jgi:hypothetical protein